MTGSGSGDPFDNPDRPDDHDRSIDPSGREETNPNDSTDDERTRRPLDWGEPPNESTADRDAFNESFVGSGSDDLFDEPWFDDRPMEEDATERRIDWGTSSDTTWAPDHDDGFGESPGDPRATDGPPSGSPSGPDNRPPSGPTDGPPSGPGNQAPSGPTDGPPSGPGNQAPSGPTDGPPSSPDGQAPPETDDEPRAEDLDETRPNKVIFGQPKTESEDATGGQSNGGGGPPNGGGGPPNGGQPGPDDDDRVTIEDDGIFRWFFKTNDGTVVIVRDLLTSVAIVAVIGLLLFGASGIWPPLVAVESGSMEPNMSKGDLIFVVDENRYAGDGAIDDTGVVPFTDGAENGHSKFGEPGDVIIFSPGGDVSQTPVIHRAYYWVEEGENWVDEYGHESRLGGYTCEELQEEAEQAGRDDVCPAPHDGFITKGDANSGYDQVSNSGADTTVVRPEWVNGKGMFRIPWLGHVRLTFDRLFFAGPTVMGSGVVPLFLGVFAAGGALAGVRSGRR